MAYETDAYTDQYDLLEKIAAFLDITGGGGDNTWTVDSFIADTQKYPSGTGASQKRLHIHKTASDGTVMYFNLKTANAAQIYEYNYYGSTFSGIGLYGSTGYNGGLNWDKQPGFPQGSSSTKSCGSLIHVSSGGSYYIFTSADTVIIAVNYTGERYQWLGFGCIQKFASFTGGQWFHGSGHSTELSAERIPGGAYYLGTTAGNDNIPRFLTCYRNPSWRGSTPFLYASNIDSKTSWRVTDYRADTSTGPLYDGLETSVVTNCNSGLSFDSTIVKRLNNLLVANSPNEITGTSAFFNVVLSLQRTNGFYSPVGYIDIIRQLNMQYKSIGEEITLGSDVWKIFPMHSYSSDALPYIAFAVKKS